jgi:hypothetical protein
MTRGSALILTIAICLFSTILCAQSTDQENKNDGDSLNIGFGAEWVSRYVWRAIPQNIYPNIQPSVTIGYGNFSFDVWASQSLVSEFNEVDLSLSWQYKRVTLSLYDYYFPSGLFSDNYLRYRPDDTLTTNHTLDAVIMVEPFSSLPIVLTGSLLFFGDDFDASGNRLFSGYLEMSYLFEFNPFELDIVVGGTPARSYYADKAAITNVGIRLSRQVNLTSIIEPVVSAAISLNPDQQKLFFVLAVGI